MTIQEHRFDMPWPPTVNHWHQPVAFGKGDKVTARIIKGAKARKYEEQAVKHLIIKGIADRMLKGNLAVTLRLYPPTKARTDREKHVN